MTHRRRNIDRAWEILNDRIHQGLHALIFKGRATHHWDEFIRASRTTNGFFQLLGRWLLLFQKHITDLFIDIRNRFDQLIQPLFSHLFMLSRNFLNRVGRAQIFTVRVNNRFLINDVDLPLQIIFFP